MDSLGDIKKSALILEDWLKTPQGEAIYALEETVFLDYWSQVQSKSVLQLCGPALIDSPAIHGHYFHVDLYPDFFSRGLSVCALFHRLPFPDQSMDLVVVPHVQELYAEPQLLYKEIDRVLAPNGKMLMFGVNMSSLWAVQRVFGDTVAPWSEHMQPAHITIQQCEQVGLFLQKRGSFGFLPYNQSHWLKTLPLLGMISYKQPHLGAVSVMLFDKSVLSYQNNLVSEKDV